jgi:hypothetical protein
MEETTIIQDSTVQLDAIRLFKAAETGGLGGLLEPQVLALLCIAHTITPSEVLKALGPRGQHALNRMVRKGTIECVGRKKIDGRVQIQYELSTDGIAIASDMKLWKE